MNIIYKIMSGWRRTALIKGIFLLSVAAFVGGCDGHMRMLYLQESGVEAAPQYANARVIEVDEGKDALSIVEHVALGMNLDPIHERANAWTSDGFTLRAMQENGGLWRIEMLDWPSFVRSDLSRAVEEKIVQRIESK